MARHRSALAVVASLLVAVLLLVVMPLPAAVRAQNNPDQNIFQNLYDKVEDMVIPSYPKNTGKPTQVILFEMPGLVINREEYDPAVWAAQGYAGRQPEAVGATFVDRLPLYFGPVFSDSGTRITAVWSAFMYQYIIPIVDDPTQTARVDDARQALANGTLQARYNTAIDAYATDLNKFVNYRADCLAKQPAGVCSYEGVVYRERLKRKWFSLEVARRDVAAAESKIIALQVQDLKNTFAEALYTFSSNERVDMGGAGFGQSYWLTYFTPSNFWRWWPTAGRFDYSVFSDGSTVVIDVPNGAVISQSPAFGALSPIGGGNTNYTYRPNAGYTGSDLLRYQVNTLVGSVNQSVTVTRSIQVIGPDVTIADAAFVTVKVTAASSSSSAKSFSSQASSSFSFRVGWGWFSSSGSVSSSSSTSTSSTSSVSSSSSLEFSLARVAITRPWLDTSLLSYYPVAIRNLAVNEWSDGTITPGEGVTKFRFKLLPVAMLVARAITISNVDSATSTDFSAASRSDSSSFRVSYGPFFSGSSSSSSSSSSRDYKESSSATSTSISIRGPQIIGWVCTPTPAFPTADETAVRKWEAEQVLRQEAARNPSAALARLATPK